MPVGGNMPIDVKNYMNERVNKQNTFTVLLPLTDKEEM
jgi:hypothetical protein